MSSRHLSSLAVRGGLHDAAGGDAAGVCQARHLGGLDARQQRLGQARLDDRADDHFARGEVPYVLVPEDRLTPIADFLMTGLVTKADAAKGSTVAVSRAAWPLPAGSQHNGVMT